MSVFHTATSFVVLQGKHGHYVEKTTVGNALRLIDENKACAHFLDVTEAGRYADYLNQQDIKPL